MIYPHEELFRDNEINNPNEHNRVKFLTPTGGRQTSWLFTSMAEELNSGLPRATPATAQSGICTPDLRVSSPAP